MFLRTAEHRCELMKQLKKSYTKLST